MKLGLAVAIADALPSAFVAFRYDLPNLIDRYTAFGFYGVELVLRDGAQVDVEHVDEHLCATGLEIARVSSDQVFAAVGMVGGEGMPDELKRLLREWTRKVVNPGHATATARAEVSYWRS